MQKSSKYYGENGIHRVPLWRIGGFALNNTATNLYMFMMGYVSYYLLGWVGVSMMIASSFSMFMRLWDGVTDPFVGFLVDKTNGKFGKNRPFMIIGNVILCVTSYIMFHVTHLLPEGPIRFAFFIRCGRSVLCWLHLPVCRHQVRTVLPDQRPQAAPPVRFLRRRLQHHPVRRHRHCGFPSGQQPGGRGRLLLH